MAMQLRSLKLLEDVGFSAEQAHAIVRAIDIMIDESEIGAGGATGVMSRDPEIGSSGRTELTKSDLLLLRYDVMDIRRKLQLEINCMYVELCGRIREVRENLEAKIERTRHSPDEAPAAE